ncbi:peroxide stress protein YaaA [soil metagenome]
MLFLLSPAKSLDFDSPFDGVEPTLPQFIPDSAKLIGLLKTQTPSDIAGLMNLSEPLANLNVARYKAWRRNFTPQNSKPAVLAFDGDVYGGLQAKSLSHADLAWAQEHVAILSGLYGVLRPLDRIQPYRLEMGTRLENPKGKDLYAYWGDRLAKHLNKQLAGDESPVIVNLASQEYFRAADRKVLKARVVECVFEDWKNDQYKIISFFAKRARGAMARYAIQKRITSPKELQKFDVEGYGFDAKASGEDRFVFRRKVV